MMPYKNDEMKPGEPESATVFDLANGCPLCGNDLLTPWPGFDIRCGNCGATIHPGERP